MNNTKHLLRLRFIFISILVFIPVFNIFSADKVTNLRIYKIKKKWIIRKVHINGKNKIKKDVLLKSLKIEESKKILNISLNNLKDKIVQKLNNLKYFYGIDVSFKIENDFLDIYLKLKDKTTFIPIPVISYSQKKLTLGAGFNDGNFLGTMNQLAFAIFFYDKNFNYLTYFYANNFFANKFDFAIYATYTKKPRYEYNSTDIIKEYKKIKAGANLDFIYRASDRLRFTMRVDLFHYNFEDGISLPEKSWGTYINFSMIYGKINFVEDWAQGFRLRLSFGTDVGFLGSELDRRSLNWKLETALNPWFDHTIVITQNGAITGNFEYGHLFVIGGKAESEVPGIRGYKEGQFQAKHYINTAFEYRIPLLSSKLFIYSFVPFIDHAVFSSKEKFGDPLSRFSFGLALRAYIRRLLIPAVSVYAAYAEGNDEWNFGFSIGGQL